jgi:hypothetical protein
MKRSNKVLSAAAFAASVMLACPFAFAESEVSDPGAFGITVDPNAAGTKVSGFVTLSYDYDLDTSPTGLAHNCPSGRFVKNLYAVATLQKGNQIQPFNSNYFSAGLSNLADCFDNQANQLAFLRNFIEKIIIPRFFGCMAAAPGAVGNCPAYAVKSVKNFLTTGVGAGSMEIELAVK